eukprot:79966-Lingulodinium_polyedra.AAC.1
MTLRTQIKSTTECTRGTNSCTYAHSVNNENLHIDNRNTPVAVMGRANNGNTRHMLRARPTRAPAGRLPHGPRMELHGVTGVAPS